MGNVLFGASRSLGLLEIVFKFFVKFNLTFPMNNVMIKSDVLLEFSSSNPEGQAGSYYDKLAVTEVLQTEKRKE